MNECIETADICPKYATCYNTNGSYYCLCSNGYTGDGRYNCSGQLNTLAPHILSDLKEIIALLNKSINICLVDLDECVHSPKACDDHANCFNVPGSYSCQCKSGYSGNAKIAKIALKCGINYVSY